MNDSRRAPDTLSEDQRDIIRSEGWEWESLTPSQIQVYIAYKVQQVQGARNIVDGQRRDARMKFLLSRIQIGLQLKAIKYGERGLKDLRKRIHETEDKIIANQRLNPFDEPFLQCLRAEEKALVRALPKA